MHILLSQLVTLRLANSRLAPYDLRLWIIAQLDVALIALLADLVVGDGRAHRAVGLMCMRASAEVALAQERAELPEAPVQLVLRKLPQAKLANARGIGHIAAAGSLERMQLGDRRGVAALM